MPSFYILRVVREDNPLDRTEVQVKFFPILTFDGLPIMLSAHAEPEAWEKAKTRFPFHSRNLAIQEVKSYDRIIGGLVAKRILRGYANPDNRAKTTRPVGLRELGAVTGISSASPIGPAEKQTEAELAF